MMYINNITVWILARKWMYICNVHMYICMFNSLLFSNTLTSPLSIYQKHDSLTEQLSRVAMRTVGYLPSQRNDRLEMGEHVEQCSNCNTTTTGWSQTFSLQQQSINGMDNVAAIIAQRNYHVVVGLFCSFESMNFKASDNNRRRNTQHLSTSLQCLPKYFSDSKQVITRLLSFLRHIKEVL